MAAYTGDKTQERAQRQSSKKQHWNKLEKPRFLTVGRPEECTSSNRRLPAACRKAVYILESAHGTRGEFKQALVEFMTFSPAVAVAVLPSGSRFHPLSTARHGISSNDGPSENFSLRLGFRPQHSASTGEASSVINACSWYYPTSRAPARCRSERNVCLAEGRRSHAAHPAAQPGQQWRTRQPHQSTRRCCTASLHQLPVNLPREAILRRSAGTLGVSRVTPLRLTSITWFLPRKSW